MFRVILLVSITFVFSLCYANNFNILEDKKSPISEKSEIQDSESLGGLAYYSDFLNDILILKKDSPKERVLELSSKEIRDSLKYILKNAHISRTNKVDLIVKSCHGAENCYERVGLSYSEARKFLFGDMRFFLKQRENGEYFIRDTYCNKDYTSENSMNVGPMTIPNHEMVNTEHLWPQSRFCVLNSTKQCRSHPDYRSTALLQKSDLHHLFATDNRLNSVRGNYKFGEVTAESANTIECRSKINSLKSLDNVGISLIGQRKPLNLKSESGDIETVFEPPVAVRGDIARALFYFSVNYSRPIDNDEELYLRKWHTEDPVSEEEKIRHEGVFEAQKNRNPFIDFPHLVDRIEDF